MKRARDWDLSREKEKRKSCFPVSLVQMKSLLNPVNKDSVTFSKQHRTNSLHFETIRSKTPFLFTLLHRGQALAVGPEPGLLRVELEELGRGVGLVGWGWFWILEGKKRREH